MIPRARSRSRWTVIRDKRRPICAAMIPGSSAQARRVCPRARPAARRFHDLRMPHRRAVVAFESLGALAENAVPLARGQAPFSQARGKFKTLFDLKLPLSLVDTAFSSALLQLRSPGAHENVASARARATSFLDNAKEQPRAPQCPEPAGRGLVPSVARVLFALMLALFLWSGDGVVEPGGGRQAARIIRGELGLNCPFHFLSRSSAGRGGAMSVRVRSDLTLRQW